MSFGKVYTLSTGATIPQIGLGTWLSKPNEVENAVNTVLFFSQMRLFNGKIYLLRSKLLSRMDTGTLTLL